MAWTYIYGTIDVEPVGRTQEEKTYVLETVLKHLPVVSSTEGDMDIHVIKNNDYNSWSSTDEFGMTTNNLYNNYDRKDRRGSLRVQRTYSIFITTGLRHTDYSDGYRQFQKWICRLAKRVRIIRILIEINSTENRSEIINDCTPYQEMLEMYSYTDKDKDPEKMNWCDYLLWDRVKGMELPIILAYKYYADEENDKEAQRRINYYKE